MDVANIKITRDMLLQELKKAHALDSTGSVESQGSFESKADQLLLHLEKQCKPCAYFVFKPDGCKNEDACPFCHICDKTEAKQRKRMSAKNKKKPSNDDDAASAAALPATRAVEPKD